MLLALATVDGDARETIGGKAASLVRLRRAGMNVPAAVVLSVDFFSPWLTALMASSSWRHFNDAFDSRAVPTADALALVCSALKEDASGVALTAAQADAIADVERWAGSNTLAVRSSSPEEDLAGASFAGLYETVSNVPAVGLESAVRRCFASCFDVRVLLYKHRQC